MAWPVISANQRSGGSRRFKSTPLRHRVRPASARLLAKQGRRDDVRATLAEIYGWFTEGFAIADLKEAKALLNQL